MDGCSRRSMDGDTGNVARTSKVSPTVGPDSGVTQTKTEAMLDYFPHYRQCNTKPVKLVPRSLKVLPTSRITYRALLRLLHWICLSKRPDTSHSFDTNPLQTTNINDAVTINDHKPGAPVHEATNAEGLPGLPSSSATPLFEEANIQHLRKI